MRVQLKMDDDEDIVVDFLGQDVNTRLKQHLAKYTIDWTGSVIIDNDRLPVLADLLDLSRYEIKLLQAGACITKNVKKKPAFLTLFIGYGANEVIFR